MKPPFSSNLHSVDSAQVEVVLKLMNTEVESVIAVPVSHLVEAVTGGCPYQKGFVAKLHNGRGLELCIMLPGLAPPPAPKLDTT
jgi:hypothetical protein